MSFVHGSKRNGQRGVVLLITIFALVLISAVAAAMILMSGTESALSGNFRKSTSLFYAAQAGVEEARERADQNAPDTLRTNPLFPNATPPNVVAGQVLYILNPAPGDPAYNPQSDPPTSLYYDSEYQQEFGTPPVPNPAQDTPSSSLTTVGGFPPLNYKWVRITLKSEAMGGVDVNGDGILDPTTPLLSQASGNQCLPSMPNCSNSPSAPVSAPPVYRLTALAVGPTGGKRLVQAEVSETPLINPMGAIASQASVKINGNFNAFGGWPPIVQAKCSGRTISTCGNYDQKQGQVNGDCTQPYDPTTDTCAGVPRNHNDYCNGADGKPAAAAADSVSSQGTISAGASYSQVPDQGTACTTTGPGCIYTVSPAKALDPGVTNWPYDMSQLISMWQPPLTEPITDISGITCGSWSGGTRTCQGQGVQMGTLPSPWPPPPYTNPTNYTPKLLFADVGAGGLVKLTGASSGSGILVVNGDLTIEAGFQWYGEILVQGVVTFLGGGSPGTNIVGGILAGKDVTNANTTSGGSVSVIFDSCAYRTLNQNAPLRLLSFREITQ